MTTVADTRAKLLHSAYSLMLGKGYAATSVDEICAAANCSKGSFYHFFKTKQQIALAMLDWHLEESRETLAASERLQEVQGAAYAIAYVREIEERSEAIWSDGCLIGTFALELAESDDEIRRKVSRILRDLTDQWEIIFEPLCRASRGADVPSPRELAEQLLAVIEGGVVLSRAHYDKRHVRTAIRCFRRFLETLAAE